MSHVAYTEWVDLVQRVMRTYGRPGAVRVFEIGGGTGVLGGLLRGLGYRYQGSDLSPDMCRIARSRDLPFVCADGRALPVAGPYDLALFLYDGINYLETGEHYAALFREVHRILAPGGLFLFDITTQVNSRRYFHDTRESEDLGDAVYLRHSWYDETSETQHNDFVILAREPGSESYRRSEERHCQWVPPPAAIRQRVPEALFETVGAWDGFSARPYGRGAERVHFLLRARGAA